MDYNVSSPNKKMTTNMYAEKEQRDNDVSALVGENLGISGVRFVADRHTDVWRR